MKQPTPKPKFVDSQKFENRCHLFIWTEEKNWNLNAIRVEVMRASGPGGQHVNKTCSAVRIVHLPTGLTAVSQDGRSQQQNRKIALMRLKLLLRQQEGKEQAENQRKRWDLHNELVRGNPIRVFEGEHFKQRSSL